MKRPTLFFAFASLVPALIPACIALVSCEDPSGGRPKNEIRPVAADAEITAFFDRHTDLLTVGLFAKENEYGEMQLSRSDSCVMINSMEELYEIDRRIESLKSDHPEVVFSDGQPLPEFPEIDFDLYTLIMGLYSRPSAGKYLASQGVVIGTEENSVYLYIESSSNKVSTDSRLFPFWGLYSKLPEKPVTTIQL